MGIKEEKWGESHTGECGRIEECPEMGIEDKKRCRSK